MPVLCTTYTTVDEARAEVERLLAAGCGGDEIRVLSGSAAHDHAADAVGRFAGGRDGGGAGRRVRGRASTRRPSRRGSFAGDAELRRRGGFGDLDRDTVATYSGGVRHVRVASHRDLHGMLVDAGLDAATAEADVRALHDGRVVVLVRS